MTLAPDWRTRVAVSSKLPGRTRPPPVSELSRPSPARRVRPRTATSQPDCAKAMAVAFPIPRVAPVTKARLRARAEPISRCLADQHVATLLGRHSNGYAKRFELARPPFT